MAARSVNSVMTAAYWEIGRRIVEHEQGGAPRAGYDEALLAQLSLDLTKRFGRGFSVDRLETARLFYATYPVPSISATPSRKLDADNSATPSRILIEPLTSRFVLSWSHYILLIRRARSSHAREFYETEAMRGGWTVRQLERQIDSQFYERTALSKNKAAMLKKGAIAKPEDAVTPEEEIKDPFVLEFLGLKDECNRSSTRASSSRNIVGAAMRLAIHQRCVTAAWRRARVVHRMSQVIEKFTV